MTTATEMQRGARRQAQCLLAAVSTRLGYSRAVDRLVRIVDPLIRPPGSTLLRRVHGVTYDLDTRDHIDRATLYFGGYGRTMAAFLARAIGQRPAVVWDVGANVGTVSLPLAVACPHAHIHAFEPSPPVLARLHRNLSLNPSLSSRVQVHEVALSDRTSRTEFHLSQDACNSGVGSIVRRPEGGATTVSVQCARADELVAQGRLPPPEVIKIDVEGFELEVIRGLSETLRAHPVKLVFEHDPALLRERGHSLTAVSDELRALGYSLHVLRKDGRVEAFLPGSLSMPVDLIAEKQ